MSYKVEAWVREWDFDGQADCDADSEAQYLADVADAIRELMPTHEVVVVTKIEDADV